MRNCVSQAGARGIAIRLSDDVGTAVTARLAQLATPGAVVGVFLPCGESDADDGRQVAAHLSLDTVRIDLSAVSAALAAGGEAAIDSVPSRSRSTSAARGPRVGEMQSRLRMTAMYFVAEGLNYVVAGTTSSAELSVGYFSKHGEAAVDLLPLGRLARSQIRTLARDLGIPQSIADRHAGGHPPADSDEDRRDMTVTLDGVDQYLSEGPQAVSPAVAMKIERLMRGAEHKFRLPAMPT